MVRLFAQPNRVCYQAKYARLRRLLSATEIFNLIRERRKLQVKRHANDDDENSIRKKILKCRSPGWKERFNIKLT